MRHLIYTYGLLLSFTFILIWQFLNLEALTVPIIGFLTVVYLVFSLRQKKPALSSIKKSDQLMIGILSTIILLIIFATGGLLSPLFFLLYFLPFAISIILSPESIFIYLLGILAVFLPMAISEGTGNSFIAIASVLLITPLAYFFGKEFRIVRIHEQKDKQVAKQIRKDALNVFVDQGASLPDTDNARLVNIIKESDSLLSE